MKEVYVLKPITFIKKRRHCKDNYPPIKLDDSFFGIYESKEEAEKIKKGEFIKKEDKKNKKDNKESGEDENKKDDTTSIDKENNKNIK